MAAVSVPLNAEPADAKGRAEHGLPPKTFAEAVIEGETEHTAASPNYSNGRFSSRARSTTAVNSNDGKKEQADEDEVETKAKTKTKTKTVHEKHAGENGDDLVSVKPDDKYHQALKHSGESAPQERKRSNPSRDQKGQNPSQAPLESGRKAGAGWQRSAIRWAPLNVPVQRRLQTLAVLWHSTSIAVFLTSFLLLCAIPLAWPLIVPYLIYTLIYGEEHSNGNLSRRSLLFRGSKVWSAFASYFPARLHRTTELEPTRKYIFGYHPHGIISHGAFAAFATEALGFSDLFPGITNTLLTLDSNFRIPFYRDYALAMGLASVSRESIENLLSKGGLNGEGMGRAVTIVVGGARESLDAQPHYTRLVLNSRKGFVKLAIRTGADLVPIMAFGENDLYEQVDSENHPFVHKFQLVLKKVMGFTVPLFHARGIFNYDVGLMPYRNAVNIVVGKPIRVVQQGGKEGHVDTGYLDQVHAEYVTELTRLWNEYKDTFAKNRVAELEIVD